MATLIRFNRVATLIRFNRVATLILALALPGCGGDFFGFDGDDEVGDSGSGETGDPEPTEGIRVFPRYQLVDVAAVVSVEAQGGGTPTSCPAELGIEGGYLCDTTTLGASTVIVRVERDGFEPYAIETASPIGYVDSIAAHLVPVGGPLGTWSACLLRDAYANCDEVCAAEAKTCVATSCASEDPSEPIATVLGYEGTQCAGAPSRVEAQACSSGPPAAFTDSLRCCCAGG
ncbi:hypothetical protein ACNOYE_22245 [Nannocystaceae bacterium ST9]